MSVGFGTLALFLPQAKYAIFPSLIVSLNLFPYLSNEFIELGGLEMEISWSSAPLCACWRTRFVINVGSVTLLLRKVWPVKEIPRDSISVTLPPTSSPL